MLEDARSSAQQCRPAESRRVRIERPIGPVWTLDTPLRRAADRRNTQVEIDAMVAIMLGVPIENLCTIYGTQFAVLYGYDSREYPYDTNRRLVPHEVLNRCRKAGEPQDPAAMSVQDAQQSTAAGIAYTYIPRAMPFLIRL